MKFVISSLIIIVIISCSVKNNENVSFSNDEYKIYSQVIDSLYYQKEISTPGSQKAPKYKAHHYVLIDSTNADSTAGIAEKLAANGISSSELINNLLSVNSRRYSLNVYSQNAGNIKLISLDKYKSYYRETRGLNDGGMTGFIKFSNDYPHSFGTSVFQVTRVGFSSTKQQAVVGTMHLRGINMGYDYTYLEKAGEKWVIRKIINH